MRIIGYLTFSLVAATALTGGPAFANICQAGRLTCATTKRVGGYCECAARGTTEGGTVVTQQESRRSRQPLNSTTGGCGAQANAPGCR
jgi:hypothetical protein